MMRNYSVVALLDFHCEYRMTMTIAEGCIEHPNIEPVFSQPVYSLGIKLADMVQPFDKLIDEMRNADYIILINQEHFGCGDNKQKANIPNPPKPYRSWEYKPSKIWNAINVYGLWNKVLYYDVRDIASEIDADVVDNAFAYFKRSNVLWSGDPDRRDGDHGQWEALPKAWTPMIYQEETLSRECKKPIYSLPLNVINAYLHPSFRSLLRPIDVGFYFDKRKLMTYGLIYSRRKVVMDYLTSVDWGNYNVKLERDYRNMNFYDDPVCKPLMIPCPWADYMRLLNKTKIIIDALPSYYTQTNRPYEAMVSGALCFLDEDPSLVPNQFKDGKHCFRYNAADPDSVKGMVEKVKYYLRPENEVERLKIAQAGYDHSVKYMRSVNRVHQMFTIVKEIEND